MDAVYEPCGACGYAARVSVECVRARRGALCVGAYVLAMALVAWQGFSRMAEPYSGGSAYGVAVAIMVAAVVFLVALTVAFARMGRPRPCRVARCPRCGRAVALDPPPAWSSGWEVR